MYVTRDEANGGHCESRRAGTERAAVVYTAATCNDETRTADHVLPAPNVTKIRFEWRSQGALFWRVTP